MIDVDDIRGIIVRIREIMTEQRDYLIKIDGELGDGDLGLTMVKAFVAADEFLQTNTPVDVGTALMQAGMQMAKKAPSTMGTLLATGFMRGGKAVQGKADLDVVDIAKFFEAFVNGVMERGKAKPGEKTLVDVLEPVVETLGLIARGGDARSASAVFPSIYDAAASGLERTKEMKAVHGRPAYYGEKTVGKVDPGGTAALFVIQGFKDHFEAKS